MPFPIGGPASSAWREQAFSRAADYRFLARLLLPRDTEHQREVLFALERKIDAAEHVPGLFRRLTDFLSGAGVERTNSQLDGVETDLLRLVPDSYLLRSAPDPGRARARPPVRPRSAPPPGREGRGRRGSAVERGPAFSTRARSGARRGSVGQLGEPTEDQAGAQLPQRAARERPDPHAGGGGPDHSRSRCARPPADVLCARQRGCGLPPEDREGAGAPGAEPGTETAAEQVRVDRLIRKTASPWEHPDR